MLRSLHTINTLSRVSLLLALAGVALLLVMQQPSVPTALADEDDEEEISQRYIVTLRPGVSPELVSNLVDMRDDAIVLHTYSAAVDGFAGAMTERFAGTLAAHPFVEAVEPDRMVTLDAQAIPTGIRRSGADENANSSIDGVDNLANIDIAVIDTGVDSDHADLNVVGGFASYLSQIGSWVLCGANTDSWEDGHGHGTHVSGTIAARDNNIGVVGMAPGARIWAVRVLSPGGGGCMSDVIAGVDWVTENADVIEVANMSLGGGNYPLLCTAINNSVAAGVFFAVAAGNGATNAENSSPANCANATTVSAIVDTDGEPGGNGPDNFYGPDDTFASFTNYGSVVDIAAPGVSIHSTYFTGGYATMSGTSMASPHVAGAAALHILKSGAPTNAAGVQAIRDALVTAAAPQAGEWGVSGDPDAIHEPVLCVGTSCAGGPPPTNTATDTPANTATNTQVPTSTATAVPQTDTATAVPPTDTPAPEDTNTPTSTSTPLPPTDTPTPQPPTHTPTPQPPANTPTNTNTPVPPTNTQTPTDTPVPPTATETPVPGSVEIYLTLGSTQTIDGVSATNEDILAFDGSGYSMYFDGSDVGLGSLAINSFSVLDDDEILISFTSASNGVLPIGFVDDSDIVKFTATSLGEDTAGSFQLYFDGGDVGLSSSSEDIDAFSVLPSGHIVISTAGGVSVSGTSGSDEDMVQFLPISLGNTTVGGWSLYFDGSDVGLSSSSEDIDGAHVDEAGDIFLSTLGNFSVSGLSGNDEDIVRFTPASLGSSTSGNFVSPLFFDGSTRGVGSNDVVAFDLP